MNPETELKPTTVEVWSRDSILYSDHPARIVGPWEADPTRTVLQLGESGPGLFVAAATVAGRYVVSLSDKDPLVVFRPEGVEPPPGLQQPASITPFGIIYAGPPCEWAQRELAKVFGKNAAAISHAELTEGQREAAQEASDAEHFIMYVGMVASATRELAECALEGVEAGLDSINNPLFVGVVTPEPEQLEQAASRREDRTIALLEPIMPPAPPEA